MSNVKGNDIDDLFKRASDKYPLRTDSADWDKLAAALEKDPSLILPPPSMEGDRRRWRRFFWLFLLLPLGGLVYYIGQTTGRHTARTTGSVHVPSSQQAPAPAGSASGVPAQTTGSTATTPGGAGPTATAEGSVGPAVPAQKSANPVTPAQPGSAAERSTRGVSSRTGSVKQPPAQTNVVPAGSGRQTPAASAGAPVPTLAAGSVSGDPTRTVGSTAITQGSVLPARPLAESARPDKYGSSAPAGPYKTKFSGKAFQDDAYTPGRDRSRPGKISLTDGGNNGYDPALSNLNWQRARIADGVALNVTVKVTNTTTTAKDSSNAKAVSKKNNKKQSFFYAGLIVAPDLSMVKFQSVKGVGTTFGILLGYNINRKWAIETGAYLDHKKYYTDGEYFKQKYPNPNSTLKNVDGACNMWEIPVNVRYNLSSGEKTKWFATAGLSTYLMTHENYVSWYVDNSGGSPWNQPWETKKPSQYWFSVFNLSIGYEQKLGKIGNLRLEPYLRIPLSGMGSGSLPIMSAGLNIGITRKLW